jgi:hypothetical protein
LVAALHLPEETLALHLLLERLQRLVDVVVADNDLNDFELSISGPAGPGAVKTTIRARSLPSGR